MTTTPNQDDAEEVRREHFNAWYAGQAMPDLLARIDPQQAAHNAFEEGVRFAAQPQAAPQPEAVAPMVLALHFHEAYERLAPSFGYETRAETRKFDPASPNAKLMEAVCAELLQWLAPHPTGGKP